MSDNTTLNGVDVELVKNTVAAIQDDPDLAKFQFRLDNKWISAGHNQSIVTDLYGAKKDIAHKMTFTIDTDEPEVLAGSGSAAGPAEYLISSLVACITTGIVYHGAVRGIKIDEIESHVEADVDLRGFLGLSDEVRKGPSGIRVTLKVKTDEQDLGKLEELVGFSPVLDLTRNGTDVDVRIERA